MLRTPDRAPSVHDDLSFEDAFDALVDRPRGPLTPRAIDEQIIRLLINDVSQEPQHADHRVIIKGDVLVVAFSDRKVLRPAAVVVLRFQEVIKAGQKGVPVTRRLGCGKDARQKDQLAVGGAVIDRCINFTFLAAEFRAPAFIQRRGHVDILRPTAGLSLIEEQIVGDRNGGGGRIPGAWLIERVPPFYFRAPGLRANADGA